MNIRSIALAVILSFGAATAATAQTTAAAQTAVPSKVAPKAVSGKTSEKTVPATTEIHANGDVAVAYQWMRSNTQPGDCGCFSLNGAGISASRNLGDSQWAAVVAAGAEFATNGPGTGSSLTLASYLAGARYYLPPLWSSASHPLHPFGQVLLGAAHAGGGIAGAGDGSMAFDVRVGGGIDLPLGDIMALRLAEAYYDRTAFANGMNGRQNNLMLGTGIVFHW